MGSVPPRGDGSHALRGGGSAGVSGGGRVHDRLVGYGLLVTVAINLIGAGIVVWKLPARHGAMLKTLEMDGALAPAAVE